MVGLHGEPQAGIDYFPGSMSSNGEPVATGVIVSGSMRVVLMKVILLFSRVMAGRIRIWGRFLIRRWKVGILLWREVCIMGMRLGSFAA